MTRWHIQLTLSRLLLRVCVYTVLLSIALSMNWINPTGSILQNIFTGFFLWVIPQLVVYFFLRGRDFGFSKGWLIRGVIFAVMLTLFLNQGWINPDGAFFSNTFAGIVLYVGSYLGSFALN